MKTPPPVATVEECLSSCGDALKPQQNSKKSKYMAYKAKKNPMTQDAYIEGLKRTINFMCDEPDADLGWVIDHIAETHILIPKADVLEDISALLKWVDGKHVQIMKGYPDAYQAKYMDGIVGTIRALIAEAYERSEKPKRMSDSE